MDDTQWYYSDAGRASGPHAGDHLRHLLATGAIRPDTLVWNPALPDWRPARLVAELVPPATAVGGASVYPDAPNPALPPSPGAPLARAQYATPTGQSFHGSAVSAFIMSLLGVLIPCAGPLLGLVGLILGVNAISNMNRSKNQDGRGLATTALALGIIALLVHGTCLGIGLPHRWYYQALHHW